MCHLRPLPLFAVSLLLMFTLIWAESAAGNLSTHENPYICDTTDYCVEHGTGDWCMDGSCVYADDPYGCETDVECYHKNLGDTCMEGYCVDGSDPSACTSDDYCQYTRQGNECMDGICGYSDEPYAPPSPCLPALVLLSVSLLFLFSRR